MFKGKCGVLKVVFFFFGLIKLLFFVEEFIHLLNLKKGKLKANQVQNFKKLLRKNKKKMII